MRISKLLKLMFAAVLPLYVADTEEAGSAASGEAKPDAESSDSSTTSQNNPITPDTTIPTTDTPVTTLATPQASGSLESQQSLSDSQSVGGSVLSSGEPGNVQVSDSAILSGAASQAAISSTPTPTIGDAPSATSASPTSTVNGLESNGAPSITDTTAETDLPGEDAVSPAASSPASATSSSVSPVSPAVVIEDTAADSSLLAAGKVDAAVIPAPVVASTSGGVVGGLLPVAPLPVVDSGNVTAAGAQDADGTGSASDEDRHPAVPHLQALRRKIESGEAIVMAELLRLLNRIEESL